MNIRAGFSMIELMIVITIIAILTSLAVPVYQNYTIRAKVAEGFALAGAAKLAVVETQQSTGTVPTTNTTAGLGTISSNYVTSIVVGTGGAITITYNAAAIGGGMDGTSNLIVLQPTFGTDTVTWSCNTAAGSNVALKYRPNNCKP